MLDAKIHYLSIHYLSDNEFTADFMNQSLRSLKWRVYAKRINNYANKYNYEIKYTKVFAFTSANFGSFVIF